MSKHNRLHPELVELLEASGLEWELELGTKHHKLRVQGRLVQVIPRGRTAVQPRCRQHLNCMASVRRALRELAPSG